MANSQYQRSIDQRGLKTLALWGAWTVASATVFGMMYRQADILHFVEQDSTRITWIIAGMFVLGVVVSFVQAVILTSEWTRGIRIETLMKRDGLMGIKRRRERLLVDRFITSLQTILERNGRLDIESLVDVEFSSQHRISQFVGLLGNLLITLGLIGTVLGMTLTMNGLNGALGSLGENEDLLMQGLRSAMAGMGVAFYTTLLGSVLGGVILRVYSWITDASVNSLQDLMLRSFLVHASADMEPSAERDLRMYGVGIARLQENLSLLKQAMQASREEMRHMSEDAVKLHAEFKQMAEEDPVRDLAISHARYAYAVRPGWLARLFSFRGPE
ncbi:MAG TPA: MotA/TolQ/ExbB proton channel family protein [Mariprofundaceae bacterium]|nr:MotA/TolQ/ExbB proton channel family protein [Mariprofundaceae bacterium]